MQLPCHLIFDPVIPHCYTWVTSHLVVITSHGFVSMSAVDHKNTIIMYVLL